MARRGIVLDLPDENTFFKKIQEIAKFDFHQVKPIVWEDYSYQGRSLYWVAERIEQIVKDTEEKFPGIFDFSRFRVWRMEDSSRPDLPDYIGPDGRKVPIWSMFLFSYFLDDEGNFTVKNILNKKMKLLINKARQVGATEAWSVIIILLGCWATGTKITLAYSSMAAFQRVFWDKLIKYCPYLIRQSKAKKLNKEVKSFYFDQAKNVLYINNNPMTVAGIDTVGEALRGVSDCKILLIDEFDYIKNHRILSKVMFPAVNKAGGAVVGITTPRENGLMTFLDSNKNVAEYMGYKLIKFNILQANICSTEQAKDYMYDFFRNEYSEVAMGAMTLEELYEETAQEYMNFVNLKVVRSNYVAYNFKENYESIVYPRKLEPTNFSDKYLYPKKYIFIDHGESLSNPAACLFMAVNRYGQAFVFDELLLPDTPISTICNKILIKCIDWKIPISDFRCYIDPTLDNKTLITENNVHGTKKSLSYRKYGVKVRLPKTMGNKEENELLNDACFSLHNDLYNPITEQYGSPLIFVSERCTTLLKELTNLTIDRTKNTNQYTNMKHNHCLTGDTLVDTVSGQVPIQELVGKTGFLFSEGGKIRKFYDVRATGVETVYEVFLENGTSFKASAEHPVYIDNKPVPVGSLIPGDLIKYNSKKINKSITYPVVKKRETVKFKLWQKEMEREKQQHQQSLPFWKKALYKTIDTVQVNHKKDGTIGVLAIKKGEKQIVYNLEVEDTKCFSINGGIIVSNCYDALTLSLSVINEFFSPPKPDGTWRLSESFEEKMERYKNNPNVLVMRKKKPIPPAVEKVADDIITPLVEEVAIEDDEDIKDFW